MNYEGAVKAMKGGKDWNFSKSYSANSFGGGVLLDLCHEIDLSNVLFSVDEVVSVSAKKYKCRLNFNICVTFYAQFSILA